MQENILKPISQKIKYIYRMDVNLKFSGILTNILGEKAHTIFLDNGAI
jgi:hypothetical protein